MKLTSASAFIFDSHGGDRDDAHDPDLVFVRGLMTRNALDDDHIVLGSDFVSACEDETSHLQRLSRAREHLSCRALFRSRLYHLFRVVFVQLLGTVASSRVQQRPRSLPRFVSVWCLSQSSICLTI